MLTSLLLIIISVCITVNGDTHTITKGKNIGTDNAPKYVLRVKGAITEGVFNANGRDPQYQAKQLLGDPDSNDPVKKKGICKRRHLHVDDAEYTRADNTGKTIKMKAKLGFWKFIMGKDPERTMDHFAYIEYTINGAGNQVVTGAY